MKWHMSSSKEDRFANFVCIIRQIYLFSYANPSHLAIEDYTTFKKVSLQQLIPLSADSSPISSFVGLFLLNRF